MQRLRGLRTFMIAAGFVLAAAVSAVAQSQAVHLDGAWARRAPAGHGMASNGAVYVTITNPAGQPDALVSASTDAARSVELHETANDGGVMKMRPLARFEVPAGGKLEMRPGGHHIMLMGLTRDLKPGDTVKLRLKFERAGDRDLAAPVK